ncbi:hypothetical protein CASFOL_007236 [Castilleja foliolosa]|uniref:Transcription repressor n=1 Tax=Castilleja foliolosa TaxID=1961234 RepID=A0ABD3E8P1_9LAMI
MENQKLLLKLSRLFPSSFTSCQSRTLPDVADSSIVITKPDKKTQNDPHSSTILQKPPKPHKIYSPVPITKLPSPKVSNTNQLFAYHSKGRKCPPVRNHSSSSNSGRWFTSSDDRTRAAADGFETDTFYSLSSNSGDSLPLKPTSRRFRKCEEMKSIDERGAAASGGRGGEHQKVSDHAATQVYYQGSCRRRRSRRKKRRGGSEAVGYAVEKRTSDPYGDFRESMVEMIIEKQIFGADDLDRLFFCFLSLNNEDYHGIIFDVFSEICQTLFCN